MKEITNDDGTVETFYTKEELDQQAADLATKHKAELDDKDKHVAEKLEEFTKGKTSQEQKDVQRQTEIDAAKKLAEDAMGMVQTEKEKRAGVVQDFAISQFVGENKELADKIKAHLPMVALEIKEDKDIMEKVRLAATMAGLGNNVSEMPMFAPSGGFAPHRPTEEISDADHATFLQAVGYQVPKPPQS